MLLRVKLKDDVKLQRKLVCLANLGHYLTWAAMVSEVFEGDAMKIFSWSDLNDSGLLTKLEVIHLKSFPVDNRDELVLTWMLEEIGNWQCKEVGGIFPSKNSVVGITNQV